MGANNNWRSNSLFCFKEMVSKNLLKTGVTIFVVNALENVALLLLFGFKITRQTLIGVGVFTLVLTLILEQMGVIKK